MANAILDKQAAPAAITITLGSLATSSGGSGRQGTVVDNTTTRYTRITVFAKIKNGTSPAASSNVGIYLIRDDGAGSPVRDDGAGASDAALTIVNATQIGSLVNKASPATGDVLTGSWVVYHPGPKFTIAVQNNTTVALDSTSGNHTVEFVGSYDEVQ